MDAANNKPMPNGGLIVQVPPTPPGGLMTQKPLISAVLYGLCSMMMAFANKALMNTYNFDYQFVLMTCQMLFTAVLLDGLRLFGGLDLPAYTLDKGLQFMLPSMFYGIHSVLSLAALSGMNIPMYGVIKRCAPFMTLLLGICILGKAKPSFRVFAAVGLITVGCLIAGYGDLSFDVHAYAAGVASVVSQASYLVLLQRFAQSQSSQMSATKTLHLNSYNTLPFLFVCSIATGEADKASIFLRNNGSIQFYVIFVCVTCVGCLLNYLLFLCTTLNSALTTTIVGTTKSVFQTFIGMFTFGGISVNIFTILGILVNLTGGILYSHTKFIENRRKQQTVVDTKGIP